MGGKVWSMEEERVFWTVIVPQSVHAAVPVEPALAWPECAQLMQETMGDGARRTYTQSMLYEHHYQCINLATKSPKARAFVEKWKKDRAEHDDGIAPPPVSPKSAEGNDEYVSLILAHDPSAKQYLKSKGVVAGQASASAAPTAPATSSPPPVAPSPPALPAAMPFGANASGQRTRGQRDALSSAAIDALKACEGAMFARPFRPSHQTSSSPATESDSSAVTSDSDQGSPDHIPALPPAPRLYRPLRPLRPLAPAPPRMMDNSQQGPFSAPAFPVYPGSSFTAINAQPPRPAKRYFSPEQEDESPAKRRNIEQASQQVTQQPGQPAAHQVPPTIPRSQMAPWQQMDFRGLPLSYGRDSQYRVEHQPNAREGQPLIEPRAQVPGNPGWIGQHSPTQAYHYQPLAYYSHGRGRSGAPLPQGPYSQDNYRQNGSDASEQYPGPLPNPNGHNGRQC